ncbi:MAG: hypothetical protein F2825_05785, partial [Actinobacteria bacterium]|nr:hypothetical protein [Actinomycetota bacterium]
MTAPQDRLDLYRYVGSAELSTDYLAIMRLFSTGLLIDLSAAEIAGRLDNPGLDTDTVE